MGDAKLVDTMIVDGLWDVYNQYHMGTTAENVAKKYGVSREQQDEFALASQQKAEAAQKAGKFKDEIVPVMHPAAKGDPVAFAADEFVKRRTTLEALAGLRPAFARTAAVTAGQCLGPQRRRRRGAGDDRASVRRRSASSRSRASRPMRRTGRRSGDHGHGPGARLAALPGEGRLEAPATST